MGLTPVTKGFHWSVRKGSFVMVGPGEGNPQDAAEGYYFTVE